MSCLNAAIVVYVATFLFLFCRERSEMYGHQTLLFS